MSAPNRSPLYGWIYRLRAPDRSLYGVIAFVIAVGVGFLVLYATGDDPYFKPDHHSRWDFAAGDGQFVVVGAFALALAAVVALALAARSRASGSLRIVAALMAAVGLVSLAVAWVTLAAGH
jgi:Trk-type K+ transport system membrane component